MRRNRALEDELRQLKDSMGVSITSSPYSAPTGTVSASASAVGAAGRSDDAGLALAAAAPRPTRLLTRCSSVYDDSCGTFASPRMSPLPAGGADYIPDYSPTSVTSVTSVTAAAAAAQQQYVPMPNCEAWASTLPSSVPSPASSVHTEEYGPASGYIPTSVPSNMMGAAAIELVNETYLHQNQQQQAQHQQQRLQNWNNMYTAMYYDGGSQNAACISR